MRGRLTIASALLMALGCSPKDVYWTRQGADEAEFRRTSRQCNEKAQIQAFEELGQPGQPECTVGTRGTVCRRPDQNDPFEAEKRKNEQDRRRRYLYGQCLESRGWVRNTDGVGFKGR